MNSQELTYIESGGWGHKVTQHSIENTMAIEDDEIPPKLQLLQFIASIFATVLEDTLIELRILEHCSLETRLLKAYTDMELLLALKHQVKQPTVVDELDSIDHHKLGCVEYQLNKLHADRKLMYTVLVSTYVALSVQQVFEPLYLHVKKIIDLDDYRDQLQQDECKNKGLRRDLVRQLRQQRNHFKSVTYDADINIETLKSKVEDALLDAEMRSRYVDNWQRARTEQHAQTIGDKEVLPLTSIEYFKRRMDHEQRIHSEVEMLTNIVINETLEKVDYWMNKYDKDMEAIDLKIQLKKNDYQDMLHKRQNLEETIESHAKLMKDWVAFKDERERIRKYRALMTKSAVIVQAWWRGLMVRLQLGPYKVRKKKKAKK